MDGSLDAQLQDMQAETDKLLIQVADYRAKYPELARSLLEKNLTALHNSLANKQVSRTDAIEAPIEISGMHLN